MASTLDISDLKVLFATFSPWTRGKRSPTNGMIGPMTYFFTPRAETFVLIDQPHPGSSRLMPVIEVYKKKKLAKVTGSSLLVKMLYPILALRNKSTTSIPFKLRDFLSVLDYGIRSDKFDLFIGLESINTLAGVLLKKLGKVKTVVYYVSDYSPSRYSNKLFNDIYLYLDRLAATHADYTWDVSKAMMPARIEAGLKNPKLSRTIHVPNALYKDQINFLPMDKIDRNGLVFAGTLGEENGPDMAINALNILSKKHPGLNLHVFGAERAVDLERLKNLSAKLGLQNRVVFHGLVTDQVELSRAIQKYAIGLAPYVAIPGSPRWWADATKIRLYLAAGLVTITTQVPPLGKELLEKNAGIVIKDNVKDLANSIDKLLSDGKTFEEMRKNAIEAAKYNTWENTYSQALEKMHLDI